MQIYCNGCRRYLKVVMQYYCTTTVVPGVWDWNSGA